MVTVRWIGIVLTVGAATGCGASLGQEARTVAAADLKCATESLRVADAEKGVYLIEGCGRMGTYYCTETSALQTRCQRVTDPQQIAAQSSLAEALNDENLATDKLANTEADTPSRDTGRDGVSAKTSTKASSQMSTGPTSSGE